MQAWFLFLKNLEKNFKKNILEQWLYSLKIIKYDACNLYLEAKDTFQFNWFEEHIRPIAKKSFFNNNNHLIHIHINILNKQKEKKKIQKTFFSPHFLLKIEEDHLNPSATFSLFFPSSTNMLTYKFLTELTGYTHEKEEKTNKKLPSFNPIFIHGPTGVGKTHLLMSCAHIWKKQGKKTFYVQAETFTEHVVTAIRQTSMEQFRKAYRHIDVLIIDNIHIFSRKNATQEEFFHTFNTLHNLNCQILLSANVPPCELEDIEPRLISRFEWGISLDLKKIEQEDLKKALQMKAKTYGMHLSSNMLDFFIKTFTSNVKATFRALDATVLRWGGKEPVDLSILLQDLIVEEKKYVLTIEKILKTIADYFGIRVQDILGKTQTKECSFPRQFAMFFCRKMLKQPYMKIGKIFSRDHSTVMTSIKHIQKGIDTKDTNIFSISIDIAKRLERVKHLSEN